MDKAKEIVKRKIKQKIKQQPIKFIPCKSETEYKELLILEGDRAEIDFSKQKYRKG